MLLNAFNKENFFFDGCPSESLKSQGFVECIDGIWIMVTQKSWKHSKKYASQRKMDHVPGGHIRRKVYELAQKTMQDIQTLDAVIQEDSFPRCCC